jgi:hypothetical protein
MTELRFPDLRRIAGLMLLGALLALPLRVDQAMAAGNFPPAYVVAGVPVDATAKDAVTAREAAREEGQRTALRRLLERLTPRSDWSRLPAPNGADIAALVQDFEVSDEHNSGVRYLGSYTFRFNPNGVRRLLRSANIPITELASKPVVLVPLLQVDGAAKLWDDPNPWREVWVHTPGKGGVVPWVVPAGDLTDVGILDAPAAQGPTPDQLARLSQRYGNGDIVIVKAVPGSGAQAVLAVTISRYSPEGTPDTATTEVTGPKLDASLYQAGLQAALVEMEEGWKKFTVASATGGDLDSVQEVTVPIKSAADWTAVRERLAKVPVVRGVDLELISHVEVRVRLKIHADDNLLRVALAQQDLILTPGKPYSVLELHRNAAAAQ